MKNTTKATGIFAVVGAIIAGGAAIAGAIAKSKDNTNTKVENEIDDLDNTEVTEETTDQPEEAETEAQFEGEIE